MTSRFRIALAALLLLALTSAAQRPPDSWRDTFQRRLAMYGHRNWIVIADSAYPQQSGPGIETVLSNESQIATVRSVMAAVSRARHVRPVVYTDQELAFVPEGDAPGIGAYRQELSAVIAQPTTVPHDEIIRKLDEAGRSFNVLIIKTNMTLPYTSVFLELRAAYWGDEAEDRLRKSMKH
ncbi:MAG TPA: RbsD/FucU domain-containing protein [Bryobacteraceae bacterium]|nr:RbsD/FucU domain-containing protein [Bryobacteraceae bacterium]